MVASPKDKIGEAQARLERLKSTAARPKSELKPPEGQTMIHTVPEVPMLVETAQLTVTGRIEGSSPCLSEKFTVRVRGRWTTDQKAFLKQFSRRQKATVGELLRHIVAWHLQNRIFASSTIRTSEVSIVKRETGLHILDFLTTSTQATEIKRVSKGIGEASWLRQAVECYRTEGPLVKQQEKENT